MGPKIVDPLGIRASFFNLHRLRKHSDKNSESEFVFSSGSERMEILSVYEY